MGITVPPSCQTNVCPKPIKEGEKLGKTVKFFSNLWFILSSQELEEILRFSIALTHSGA